MMRIARHLAVALVFGVVTATGANAGAEDGVRNADTSIWLGTRGQPTSWRPVAPDQILLWASPSRPYLVTLSRPTQNIRFAQRIHVSKTGGRVTRFDRVTIDGERLPILRIDELDRETARQLEFRDDKASAF